MSQIKLKLKTPSTPNYIIIESPPGFRQDGYQESPKISIGELSNETLEEIAREWKVELLAKAQRIRSQGN